MMCATSFADVGILAAAPTSALHRMTDRCGDSNASDLFRGC